MELAKKTSPDLSNYNPPHKKEVAGQSANEIVHKIFMAQALHDMNVLMEIVRILPLDSWKKDAYEKASSDIISTCYLIAKASSTSTIIEQDIVSILHRVPSSYLDLLREKDPVAMALIARNISLLALVGDSLTWWIHGAGQCKVPTRAVQGLTDLMPIDWMWTMDWPRKVATGEVKLTPNGPSTASLA